MTKVFTCPSCGAGLDYDGDDDPIVRCAYCGSTVVVPVELRPQPAAQAPVTPGTGGALTIDLRGLPDMASKIRAVKQLLVDGQLPEAARVYQETTGSSAEESAAAVQRLAAGQSLVVNNAAPGAVRVVSGQRVVDRAEATKLVRERMRTVQRVTDRIDKVVTCAIVAALLLVIVGVGVFLLVTGALMRVLR